MGSNYKIPECDDIEFNGTDILICVGTAIIAFTSNSWTIYNVNAQK